MIAVLPSFSFGCFPGHHGSHSDEPNAYLCTCIQFRGVPLPIARMPSIFRGMCSSSMCWEHLPGIYNAHDMSHTSRIRLSINITSTLLQISSSCHNAVCCIHTPSCGLDSPFIAYGSEHVVHIPARLQRRLIPRPRAASLGHSRFRCPPSECRGRRMVPLRGRGRRRWHYARKSSRVETDQRHEHGDRLLLDRGPGFPERQLLWQRCQ
ncbi:hypothetical protein DFH06DRAFT_508669 [Mycena polygramma]|nr:hypothetical protein DFH06DRAFT_508669 [Mycena polygramma]